MEDLLRQERQKLHMAADNIRQMLEVIESRDKEHFFWAWMQIEENLNAAKQCFAGVSKEFCDKIDEIFKEHKHIFKTRKELHEKLMNNPNIEALTEEELNDITKGFKRLIEDLREKLGLVEF